jgi:hypothetical protein
MQMAKQIKNYPSVSIAARHVSFRVPDFKPVGGEGGCDGQPVEKMPARDITARDPLTGRLVREVPESPENVNNSRVSALLARKRLTRRQFDAAMSYFGDWHDGEILVSATAAPIRVDSHNARSTLSDFKLDAQDRYKRARKWLEREFDGRCLEIVEKVVLQEKIVEEASAELRIHHQRGATLLEFGCDLLGDHYGFAW